MHIGYNAGNAVMGPILFKSSNCWQHDVTAKMVQPVSNHGGRMASSMDGPTHVIIRSCISDEGGGGVSGFFYSA